MSNLRETSPKLFLFLLFVLVLGAFYFYDYYYRPYLVMLKLQKPIESQFENYPSIAKLTFAWYRDFGEKDWSTYYTYFYMKDGGFVVLRGSAYSYSTGRTTPKLASHLYITQVGSMTFYRSCDLENEPPHGNDAVNFSDKAFQERLGIELNTIESILNNYDQIKSKLSTWQPQKFEPQESKFSDPNCIFTKETSKSPDWIQGKYTEYLIPFR